MPWINLTLRRGASPKGFGCVRHFFPPHQRQHSLPHGAADIFEIDNDPVRADALQLFGAIDAR